MMMDDESVYHGHLEEIDVYSFGLLFSKKAKITLNLTS